MKSTTVHWLLALAAAGVVLPSAYATSCSRLPPCGYVRENAILFTGTVQQVREIETDLNRPQSTSMNAATVSIDEAFLGPPQLFEEANGELRSEVTVHYRGSWLVPGGAFLFDVYQGNDGSLWPSICGATDELRFQDAAEVVSYLQALKNGKADTSLTIFLRHNLQPIPSVRLAVEGPGQSYTAVTDEEGAVKLRGLVPGSYRIAAASREGYRLDPDSLYTEELVSGACLDMSHDLAAETSVSGVVLDHLGNPVDALPLRMQSVPEASEGRLRSRHSGSAVTASDGTFRFESLVPGRYLFGTNIDDYPRNALVPRYYYPGGAEPEAAFPIDVELGHPVENLVFRLPDYGPPREIRATVLMPDGQPASKAFLSSFIGPEYGALPDSQHEENGEIVATGFEKVPYRIGAMYADDPVTPWNIFSSQEVEIPPGEGPVHIVLQLESPPTKPQTSTTR